MHIAAHFYLSSEVELSTKIEKPQTSKSRNSYKKESKNTRKLWEERYAPPTPSIRWMPSASGEIRPKKCIVKRAVQSIIPSLVTITLSTATSEKQYGGIIVDPLGYIVTSAEDMDSQKKEDLSKYKVDVQLNPGMPSKCTVSGELSYVDLVNNIAIVKCKSNKPLMAAKLNFKDHRSRHFMLYVSDRGHDENLPNSLAADLVKLNTTCDHNPFPFKEVKTCVFSSNTEPSNLFGLALIVNLDGELVGLVKDNVNLWATPAKVVSKVLEFSKEYGNCQPWIGLDLYPQVEGHLNTSCHVRKVIPESPAAYAGICSRDEITKLGEYRVHSFVELYNTALLEHGKPLKVHFREETGFPVLQVIFPSMKGQARAPFI